MEDPRDLGHPALGNSYEAFVIESILRNLPKYEASFFRSSGGAEVDLVLERGRNRIAIEIKSSPAPRVTQGFWEALKVIKPQKAYVTAPVSSSFPLKNDVWVHNITKLLEILK